jgi:hypothetical protein
LFVGVNVTGPTAVGVIENVCGAVDPLNVKTIGVESPPPEGKIEIVAEKPLPGVTVKFVEAVFKAPPCGPVSV